MTTDDDGAKWRGGELGGEHKAATAVTTAQASAAIDAAIKGAAMTMDTGRAR